MKSLVVELDALLTVAAAVLDPSGVLLQANAGFLRLLSADATQPIGTRVAPIFIQPAFRALVASLDTNGQDGYRGLMTIGDPAGKMRTLRGRVWRTASGIQLLAEHDIADLERLNDVMHDLNQRSALEQHHLARKHVAMKQREAEIVEESVTDALTGVGNRRKLEQALASEISRVRAGGGTLCAIMTDIDHFKSVNDEYGHGAGDKVLARFGALLKAQMRATDTVVRFGGEEFVVLMPHANLAQAVAKAERIRAAIEAAPMEPLTRPVTSSFGVAELSLEEDGDSLLARADNALYRAKESGRNRVGTSTRQALDPR